MHNDDRETMRIRSDFAKFASVHFDPALFIPSPSNGVNRFLLDRVGDELARATSIVEYAPCSSFPTHCHVGGEEFLVLKGTFHDEHGSYPTGHYVRNPIGSHHAPFVKEDGCTIFVKLLQMADEPENVGAPSADEGKGPRSVSSGVSFSDATKNAVGAIQELYRNEWTGERVQVCWVSPNTLVPLPPTADGEELLVMAGTLLFDDEEFVAWGWLRFPAGDVYGMTRRTLRSGPTGATIWRKTGHLTQRALSLEKVKIRPDDGVAGVT
jgi:ChrR Cupin-like domain